MPDIDERDGGSYERQILIELRVISMLLQEGFSMMNFGTNVGQTSVLQENLSNLRKDSQFLQD